jgi:hypothetical protein
MALTRLVVRYRGQTHLRRPLGFHELLVQLFLLQFVEFCCELIL